MSNSERPYFDDEDAQLAAHYVTEKFGPGSFGADKTESGETDFLLSASLQSTRDYMKQSMGCENSFGTGFRPFPVLVNSLEPNAFATIHSGVHICGLKSGFYGAVFELCMTAMSSPKVFREIGDPSKECEFTPSPDSPPSFWLLDQIHEFGDIRDRSYAATIIPKDAQRCDFAHYLIIVMLRFAWFHELYHCLNGHVGSLSQPGREVCLHEMPSDLTMMSLVGIRHQSLPLDLPDYLRALELDADRTAFWGSFQTQVKDTENIIGIGQLDRRVRVKMVLFVSVLATYLFDQFALREGVSKSQTHPDAYARLHNLIRTAASHMLSDDIDTISIFHEVLDDLSRLRNSIPGLVDPKLVLAHCRDQEFQSVLEKMDDDLEHARAYFSRWGSR